MKNKYLYFGGDWNPEQWSEPVWLIDMELMQEAGVNMVSLGVFAWALLQPAEDRYEFDWLDAMIDLLWKHDIDVNLATASAAQPAWLSVGYADVLPIDERGVRLQHGSRQTYCPNSPSYRRFAKLLTHKLVERYGKHPAVIMWHVNNEYGCHGSACYCDRCGEAFRVWLKERYGGIKEVNEAWGTNFWSQRYYRWEEIYPPRLSSAQRNPGQLLDYRRFMSDSLLTLYRTEADIIRHGSPKRLISTNFMMDFKEIDYFKWAQYVDVVGLDCYPNPAPGGNPADAALNYDLARSLKDGKPFILMEQAANQVNWRPINTNKRPGWMRLLSYQALGRGADGIMFFQWRQSRQGAEKFHSGMIDWINRRDSRVRNEVCTLGRELKMLGKLSHSKRPAEVAIVFDYESWWALEYLPGPSERMRYLEGVREYYRPLFDLNIPVDFIPQTMAALNYKVIILPMGYMIHGQFGASLKRFVSDGGTLLIGPFSGIVDENDRLFEEGYLGPLRQIVGITIDEFDALEPQMHNAIRRGKGDIERMVPSGLFECRDWCEVLRLRGARSLAQFQHDYYAGQPAITVNHCGSGLVYYIATRLVGDFLRQFLAKICLQNGVKASATMPAGVEISLRRKGNDTYLVLINHNPKSVTIPLRRLQSYNLLDNSKKVKRLTLTPFDCAILEVAPS